jgi:homoserine O-acetyltransferase
MASQPTAKASRNWMLRRMMLETICNDPDYHNGNYMIQPRALKHARIFYGIATSGGTLNYQKQAPTRIGRQDCGRATRRRSEEMGSPK